MVSKRKRQQQEEELHQSIQRLRDTFSVKRRRLQLAYFDDMDADEECCSHANSDTLSHLIDATDRQQETMDTYDRNSKLLMSRYCAQEARLIGDTEQAWAEEDRRAMTLRLAQQGRYNTMDRKRDWRQGVVLVVAA